MKTLVFLFNGEGICESEGMGMHRFAAEILRRLDIRMAQDIQNHTCEAYVVIPKGAKPQLSFQNLRILETTEENRGKLQKQLWRQRVFPKTVRKYGGIGIDLTLAVPRRHCQYIAVYDCILETFPDSWPTLRGKRFRRSHMHRVKTAIRNGADIITVSECSKRDLLRWYHLPESRVTVIGCGWEHMQQVQADESILKKLKLPDGGYYFSLGSTYKYKNLTWIIENLQHHPGSLFVITGKSFDGFLEEQLSSLPEEQKRNVKKQVVLTGYLPDGQIKALMQHCKAFLHPSCYEGFGIPPLEALSQGAEVVTSNGGSLPEVFGTAVHYLDPENADVDLEALLAEPTAPPETVLTKYSWEMAAEEFYGQIIRKELLRTNANDSQYRT